MIDGGVPRIATVLRIATLLRIATRPRVSTLPRVVTLPRIATPLLFSIAAACAPASEPVAPPGDSSVTVGPTTDDPQFEIVDILPRDAIPAIDDPSFWEGPDAHENYPDDMLILGVAFDGQARAYSIPFLSRHEIVNDTVGGRAITVTW